MKYLAELYDRFFFTKISATGFGIMRAAWGGAVFLWMLSMWQDVVRYFSHEGIITPEYYPLLFRTQYRFTLLDYVTTPNCVWILYVLLLFFALMTCIGWKPRIFTTLTILLFFSFQEDNLMILGGGDTTLRTIGFILLIAPELRAFSTSRAWQQWKSWRNDKKFLEPLRMSIWPYRLLLWQALIIYVYSAFEKISGTMWLDGTAVEVFFHHPNFFRWSKELGDFLSRFSTFATYFTLIWEFAWLLLLIPKPIMERFPRVRYSAVKRGILIGGILFHGGLLIMSDVGIFPIALFTLYFGLLLDEDFDAIRAWFNRHMQQTIAVLYDGKCGLCLRSVFLLKQIDWLHRLQPVNFHYTKLRKAAAPDLTFGQLDKALHIVLPDQTTLNGFDALRRLCWHIPLLWIFIPVLYIPGIAPIGRVFYTYVANRRKKCNHESCRI